MIKKLTLLNRPQALVLGCGMAGSAAALRMAARGVQVTVLSAADDIHECNSLYAQGGIIYKSPDDHPSLLAKDIHDAGAGESYDPAVQQLSRQGPSYVEEVLVKGAEVPFHRDPETGDFALTLEASHSKARILYDGDHTGRTIMKSVLKRLQAHPLVTVLPSRPALDLVMNEDGVCVGAYVLSNDGDNVDLISADTVVLATGGAGSLYEHTSNPSGAFGAGLALAHRAGAELSNMQFFQFHPTTLYTPGETRFLLSETLRGEGAELLDSTGRRFAREHHRLAELAPRDVVARMILAEMRTQSKDHMYLDISHKSSEWLEKRFPTIFRHCMDRGFDLGRDPLPVVPAAHYHCGGVRVDLNGRTTVPGLYAAGEVSCTGLHGANRLASTSLLEGLVWGVRIADDVPLQKLDAAKRKPANIDAERWAQKISEKGQQNVRDTWKELRTVMWEGFGPMRTVEGMWTANKSLDKLMKRAQENVDAGSVNREALELLNGVLAGRLIGKAALGKTKSVGTHFLVEAQAPALSEVRFAA